MASHVIRSTSSSSLGSLFGQLSLRFIKSTKPTRFFLSYLKEKLLNIVQSNRTGFWTVQSNNFSLKRKRKNLVGLVHIILLEEQNFQALQSEFLTFIFFISRKFYLKEGLVQIHTVCIDPLLSNYNLRFKRSKNSRYRDVVIPPEVSFSPSFEITNPSN